MQLKEKFLENLFSKKMWALVLGIATVVLNAIFDWNLSDKSLEMIGYMVVGLCAGDGLAKIGHNKLTQFLNKNKDGEESKDKTDQN